MSEQPPQWDFDAPAAGRADADRARAMLIGAAALLVGVLAVGGMALQLLAGGPTSPAAPLAAAAPARPAPAPPSSPANSPPADDGNTVVEDAGGRRVTVAYALSIIDSTATEEQYGNLLAAIQDRFPGLTRHQIADVLSATQQVMHRKGVDEPLLGLGWHIEESLPRSAVGTVTLPDVASAYATLRIGNR